MHTIRSKPLPMWPAQALLRAGPVFGGSFRSVAVCAANLLLTWQERATQRHALASLDERLRRDLGLSRADACSEAAKPFWRA